MTGGKRLADRIAAWERIVAGVEAGYAYGLDDWLNDMDLRRGIDEALDALKPRERLRNKVSIEQLAASDARFRKATAAAGKCLWGSTVAAREGWHADRQWWYFRKPRIGNAELAQDIDAVA
ncbi:hypothetical protein FHP25_19705 [Vineibacter terrae]|uniref:Uncharacterized protein n=1 Tax=Vineibacter terrae TaxID=2586908 RepID=A0A5C8PKF7_9HYPH|nr:hypothetical protein [Vineibacter terrae]TXL73878.1 hypothetical protein FHP25_19705 [Vineibacter terrae]